MLKLPYWHIFSTVKPETSCEGFQEKANQSVCLKSYLTGCRGELLWQLRKSRGTLGIERRGANYESNTGIGSWRTGGHFSCEWRLRRLAGNETWRRSCRSLTGWPRGVWFWLRDWQWHRRKSPRGEIQGHRWKTLQNKHKQHISAEYIQLSLIY